MAVVALVNTPTPAAHLTCCERPARFQGAEPLGCETAAQVSAGHCLLCPCPRLSALLPLYSLSPPSNSVLAPLFWALPDTCSLVTPLPITLVDAHPSPVLGAVLWVRMNQGGSQTWESAVLPQCQYRLHLRFSSPVCLHCCSCCSWLECASVTAPGGCQATKVSPSVAPHMELAWFLQQSPCGFGCYIILF